MRSVRNYQGKVESISDVVYFMGHGATVVAHFRLLSSTSKSPWEPVEGEIELRMRGKGCLERNSHEPRPFVLCWNNGTDLSDISFYGAMSGDHGALQAVRKMFERYVKEEV